MELATSLGFLFWRYRSAYSG